PEHPLVATITTDAQRAEVVQYLEATRKKTEIERLSTVAEKTGVSTGAIVRHPITGKDVPVWIADYVLANYGTGAVMGVPAHDERDFVFAQKHGVPLKVVVLPPDGSTDATSWT